MLNKIKLLWQTIRRLSGDDAYEQYVLHYQQHHAENCDVEHAALLSREAFFKQWQERKWTGIKRCC